MVSNLACLGGMACGIPLFYILALGIQLSLHTVFFFVFDLRDLGRAIRAT